MQDITEKDKVEPNDWKIVTALGDQGGTMSKVRKETVNANLWKDYDLYLGKNTYLNKIGKKHMH